MLACRAVLLTTFLLTVTYHVRAQDDDEVIDLQELLLKVSKGFTTFSQEMKVEFASFAATLRTLNEGMKSMRTTLEEVRITTKESTTSNTDIKLQVEKTTNSINLLGQNIKTQIEQSTNTMSRFTQEVREQLKLSDESLNKFRKDFEEQNGKCQTYFKSLEQLVREQSKGSGACCEASSKRYEEILTRLNDVRDLSLSIKDSNRIVREEILKSSSQINSIVQSQKEIKESVNTIKDVTNKIHIINISVQKESSTCSLSIEGFLKELKNWKDSLKAGFDKVLDKLGTCDKNGGKDETGDGDKGGDGTGERSPVLDCADAYKKYGYRTSKVYNIKPVGVREAFPVFCDMSDGGGWTVIQRRGDYGNPDDYFFRTWADYKSGFGDLNKEFWLGNDKMSIVTSQQSYQAKIDLWDVNGNSAFARYNNFKVENELGKYILRVNGYSGTAGDALRNHNNSPFSTRDKDNILMNLGCEENNWRSGWWYGGCSADLNGLNLRNQGTRETRGRGIKWTPWLGENVSLAGTAIKIRPKDF